MSTSRKRSFPGSSSMLPVIIESTHQSPKTTPPTSSKNGNPFRKISRRASGQTLISTQDSSGKITPRRQSLSGSIDLTKSENIMKRFEKQRRESMVTSLQGRRTSFGTIGTKITALVKAKNAFAKFKRTPKVSKAVDDIPDEKAFEIEKLPRKPRFASTLSAEAQYAIMKGYEDKVYSDLCKEFPEYRSMLRRNRTPHSGGIAVCSTRTNTTKPSTLTPKPISKGKSDDVDGRYLSPSTEKMTSDNDDIPASTSTPLPGDEPSERGTMSASPVPNVIKSSTKRMVSEKEEKRLALAAAKEKQLIMTYRYQRAMDILDVLRQKQGLHSLSPRMRKNDLNIEPLKDYNSWSYVWNYEFEPQKVPAKIE